MKILLPHAYPFVLLDRVVEVESGRRAVAIKNLAATDPLLDGDGRIPAVLLAEAMAQCAGVALAELHPGAMAVLARIDRFRCKRMVLVGSQLEVRAQIVRVFGQTVKARCMVRNERGIAAAGQIILQFVSGLGPGVGSA